MQYLIGQTIFVNVFRQNESVGNWFLSRNLQDRLQMKLYLTEWTCQGNGNLIK